MFAIRTPFGIISVIGLTSLLQLEIKECSLWLSSPVHSGSLKRSNHSKQICMADLFSFEWFYYTLKEIISFYILGNEGNLNVCDDSSNIKF